MVGGEWVSSLRVIGIDPAPGKDSVVFDGSSFNGYSPENLAVYLDELKSRKDVLICWDAPLTGPANLGNSSTQKHDLTKRLIERFFTNKKLSERFRVPPGISVQGYAACQHWTISRRLLGLPRVGLYDQKEGLPFELMTSESDKPIEDGAYVVEVHPALAMWLWFQDSPEKISDWHYKGQKRKGHERNEQLKEFVRLLETALSQWDMADSINDQEIETDDHLDAFVAWLLGTLWLEGGNKVVLLGDTESGSMLLPNVEGLVDSFDGFVKP